jgi:integrase
MVKFYLEKPTHQKPTLILYCANYFGKRWFKSTQLSVHPKFWNPKIMRLKSAYPDSPIYNQFLDNLCRRSEEARTYFITQLIRPTKDQFIERVFQAAKKEINLQAKFDEFIKLKASRFSKSTRVVYQSAWNSLKDFKPKLTVLNSQVINDYSNWLLNKNYSPNYINKNVKNLCRFCEYLEIPIKLKNPVQRKDSDAVALTLDEVNRIIKTPMPSDKLESVRDLFVFSCFTGMRYSDLVKFNPELIKEIKGVNMIVQYDQKEKGKCVIPILKPTQKILSKYKNRLPKVDINTYRKLCKQVCAIAGIKDVIQMSKPKGETRQIVSMPKYEAISSHSCRRSFITIMIEEFRHTPQEVGLMTGQKTDAIIEIYNKSNPERNALKVFKNLEDMI